MDSFIVDYGEYCISYVTNIISMWLPYFAVLSCEKLWKWICSQNFRDFQLELINHMFRVKSFKCANFTKLNYLLERNQAELKIVKSCHI